MPVLAEALADEPILTRQAEVLTRPINPARRMANAIRALAIDAIERAGSGHPGLPLGMADAATVLWTRYHKFDAADPHWPDRDRFVLSAGHGSMLLYALLYLTGHEGLSLRDLQRFRQWQSPTAGHPEFGSHPAIEATTGPLGQGLACAVGMAIAERTMAARFGRSLVDHRTWVIASDGDLMEGINHEAAALAGHLALSKLTVLYDDNHVTMQGDTALASSEDVLKRYAAYGWATKRVDGHDPAQIAAALSFAVRSRKPTLIACETVIGLGAPTKAGTAAAHGAPLGLAEGAGARRNLGWDEPPFRVPEDLLMHWQVVGRRGAAPRRAWLKRLTRHAQRADFERAMAGRLPDNWHEALSALKQEIAERKPRRATRASSLRCLEALAPAVPELLGGSADLADATQTLPRGMGIIGAGNYGGRFLHFGVREHAMAAAANGMALHGGIIPYVGTFAVFSDYLRPALRLGALMHQRVIHVLTHDSIGLGEDGPTHQPVEHLASLRAMPNLHVYRPADAMETVECWELALRRSDGPCVLVLSRQAVPACRADAGENRCARGGYVMAEADGSRQVTLIATGSEVGIALAARERLAAGGIAAAVVSLPSWELFARQDESYRAQVLGGVLRVGIEAACGFGWERWLGEGGLFLGVPGFGASAPGADLYGHFGLTAEAVAASVLRRLG
ncbi:transketolase [Rhodopila sp.]|uniref:transketolase n=1 Tax=Rhodopila sp. TaxID=2480087 RepID=UPI002B632003|nr:transketolase [Rhodopila sp.]HVZ08898.1 transketolase [Rhodopila sp.]